MKNLGLIIKNEKIVVSSKDVSEVYDKRHDQVLRDIRNIIEDVPKASHNFVECLYINANNREMPMYEMDRQGFSMLVMGFTGKKAKEFTYKYTLAFEKMAKELESNKNKKLSPLEELKLHYKAIEIHDEKLTEISDRIEHLENNMTIDFSQQKELSDIAKKKALEALGGKTTSAYKDKGIRTKVFSQVWKDFKDYFEINSYRNTPRVDFDKAKQHLNNWKAQGRLLREIEECNNQLVLSGAC